MTMLTPTVLESLRLSAHRTNEDHRTSDSRGSAADRRRRKLKLLADPRFQDSRRRCRCSHCSCILTAETIEADRLIPGAAYIYLNCIPSCRSCNAARSNRLDFTPRRPWFDVRPILSTLDPKASR